MTNGLRLEVAHAVRDVHDVERMIEFYTNTLGFEVTDRGPIGPQEIVFLSQVANHHHQVAFITGREHTEPSNNVNHMAFRSSGTLDDLKELKKALEADGQVTQIRPLTHGNAFVSAEDIRQAALPALRHRLLLNFEGEAEQVNADSLVNELLAAMRAD